MGTQGLFCCNPVDCVCAPICRILHAILLLGILATSIYTAIQVSNQDDAIQHVIATIQNTIHIDAIDKVIDFSHAPTKPSEVFVNPALGSPCNGLASGDRCATGLVLLNSDTHCNNCCFHLVTPLSCSDYSCTCYASDQHAPTVRRELYVMSSIQDSHSDFQRDSLLESN